MIFLYGITGLKCAYVLLQFENNFREGTIDYVSYTKLVGVMWYDFSVSSYQFQILNKVKLLIFLYQLNYEILT